MPSETPPPVEVQFYAPDGTPRHVDPDRLLSVSWEEIDRGGMARLAAALAFDFEQDRCRVRGGDTVKVWVRGEEHPRFVGAVAQPVRTLAAAETWQITAYGPMEDMNHVRFDRVLLRPGGADLREFAAEVFDAYLAKRPGAAYLSDFPDVGVVRERIEVNGSCRAAMDALCDQAPGLLVWGWEVHPATGAVTCYLRARSAAVGFEVAVPDDAVTLTEERDFQGIVNRVKLTGGKAKQPNLLAEVTGGNTGFEQPVMPTEADGNVFADASFEARSHPLSGGASYKAADLSEGPAHTGEDMVEMDTPGETVVVTANPVSSPPADGDTWVVGAYLRLEMGGSPGAAADLTAEFLDGGGAVVGSATAANFAPGNAVWERCSVRAAAPSGATGVRLTGEATAGSVGSGLMLDDVFAYNASAVRQAGWGANPGTGTGTHSIDWAYRGVPPRQGAYCVYAEVTAADDDANDVAIEPERFLEAKFTVSGNAEYRHAWWVRRPPGVANNPKVILRTTWYDETGAQVGEDDEAFAAGTLWPDWTRIDQEVLAPSTATSARARLLFRSDGALLLDSPYFRDATAPPDEWIAADVYEREVAATEVCDPASAAYASEATFGVREGEAENPGIDAWDAAAQAWAADFFTRYAVPSVRPEVSLHDETATYPRPGAARRLRVVGLAESFGDWDIVRATFSARGRHLSVDLTLNDEEPSLAQRLARDLTL